MSVTKPYIDTGDNLRLKFIGTMLMTGSLNLGNNVAGPTNNKDA